MDTATLVVLVVGLALFVGRRFARRRRALVVSTESTYNWPPDAEVDALVRAGKKIHAIKRHRDIFRSDLVEAKEAIDTLERRLLGAGAGDKPTIEPRP